MSSSLRDSGRRSVVYGTISGGPDDEHTGGWAYLDEGGKGRVRGLLLFELVLAVELMGAVPDEGFELRHDVGKDVPDALDDGVGFLTLVECVTETCVYGNDVVNVPKDLLDKVCAMFCGDDVAILEVGDPDLGRDEGETKKGGGEEDARLGDTPCRAQSHVLCRSPH